MSGRARSLGGANWACAQAVVAHSPGPDARTPWNRFLYFFCFFTSVALSDSDYLASARFSRFGSIVRIWLIVRFG
jgi:hypothetical protein